MIERFQGDPKLYLTEDGVDLKFVSGQPVMDQGLENQVLISLFTDNGWWGNDLIDDPNKQIGSEFEQQSKEPITLDQLSLLQQIAENAVKDPLFGKVTANITNPTNNQLKSVISIEPPGSDIDELILIQNGVNWISQANNPAYQKYGGY